VPLPSLAPSLAPFRHRSYALVWTGGLISNTGTWMETTALGYYVADTSAVSASGLVAAAGFLPSAVLSPVAGAWVDRFDRKRMMLVANSASMVVAAVVALLVGSGRATPGWLAVCSFAAGCSGAIGFPAFQAVLPDLVPAEELVAAIGLSSTQWNLGRIIGPTAAAIAIAVGGISTALWINAASFGAVLLTLSLAVVPKRIGVHRRVWAAVRDGLHFARTTPSVRAMVPVMVVGVFFGAPFIGFVAQMATNVFDGDERSTSVLVTAQGVGAVAAGALLGVVSARFGVRRVLIASLAIVAPALVAYGLAPTLWSSAIALVVVGGAYMAALSSCTSITQSAAPAELRGRAMAVNNVILGACYPFGLLVQGAVADRWNLRGVTAASGVALGLGLLVVVSTARRADRS
jgi:MFS family permease